MAAEVEERYPLEKGLPRFQETPKAVNEFYQKYERYPAKVVVNPKHKVEWSEYLIPISRQHAPSIKPLDDEKVQASTVKWYHILIEYDEGVDEETIICRGFAT